MTEEIWRPVVGYEGLYDVSSYGRVRSLDRYVKGRYGNYRLHKGKILSPAKDTTGYLKVVLACNGKCKTIKVHRLVAQVFILNPDNLLEVNHKDEDKTNNRVENLEWCNRKYNCNYGSRNIRRRETLIKNGSQTGLSEKEYRRKYYEENKERKMKYFQDYREKHKEKRRENNKKYQKKWRENNKDYYKDYYEKNKEKLKDYNHQYYLKRKAGL